MEEPPIRFDDGAAYERVMGVWTQLAANTFLGRLAPATGQRWIDIGCGSGALTERLMLCCTPAEVQGIDPSEGELAFCPHKTRCGWRALPSG